MLKLPVATTGYVVSYFRLSVTCRVDALLDSIAYSDCQHRGQHKINMELQVDVRQQFMQLFNFY